MAWNLSEIGNRLGASLATFLNDTSQVLILDENGDLGKAAYAPAPTETNRDWQQDGSGDTVLNTFADAWALRLGEAAENNMTLGFNGSAALIQRTAAEQSAVQFAALTGLLYSTAGTMTALLPYGAVQIWLPAGAWQPRTTNGCSALTNTETSTNDFNIPVLDFDTAADEHANYGMWLPKSYNASTVTFQAVWTAASGSGTVCWSLRGRVFDDDDALDQAMGTQQDSSDTFITAGDAHISPASSAITLAGTPAKQRFLGLEIFRDVSADTLGVDARLIGVIVTLTTNATTDD